MSNLHQYESFELKKQPEHNLWSSCMVSILVGNGYSQLVLVCSEREKALKGTAMQISRRRAWPQA